MGEGGWLWRSAMDKGRRAYCRGREEEGMSGKDELTMKGGYNSEEGLTVEGTMEGI